MRSHGQWPLARAGATGVGAFLVGYLMTYASLAGRPSSVLTCVGVTVREVGGRTSLNDPALGSLIGAVDPTTAAGWLYANAHLVRVVERAYPTPGAVVPNLLLVDGAGRLALFLVPPAVLLAAGAFLARRSIPGTVDELPLLRATLPAGVVRGMAVWVGYLPAAVVASLLASTPTTHPSLAPMGPGLVGAVVVMGGVYPVVFGGLGGWLATRVRDATRPDGGAEAEAAS